MDVEAREDSPEVLTSAPHLKSMPCKKKNDRKLLSMRRIKGFCEFDKSTVQLRAEIYLIALKARQLPRAT